MYPAISRLLVRRSNSTPNNHLNTHYISTLLNIKEDMVHYIIFSTFRSRLNMLLKLLYIDELNNTYDVDQIAPQSITSPGSHVSLLVEDCVVNANLSI